jgi:hypothetical protein
MSMRGMSRAWFAVGLSAALLLTASHAGAGGGKWGKPKEGKGRLDTRAPRHARPGQVASPNAIRAKTADELVYGEPIRYHNLSLVPVGTSRQGPFQSYTLLEEGLKARTLAVRELNGKSGEAQVEAVEVRNKGREPVYLLGGEMILGGKQDRIISNDTVVPPSGKWTRVSVFCVEQGRWRGQNMRFQSGSALAHVALRKAAMSGDQSKVWAEVARKNLKHHSQSSTSTYRRTIQNDKVRAKLAPYRAQIAKMLPRNLKLAGVVFAINGDIRVADLFGNPLLFDKLQDKLLSAYILEALGEQVNRNAPALTKGAAKSWLGKARKAPKMKLKAQGRSINYKKEAPDVIGNEAYDNGTGQTVRETYIKK